LIYLGFVKGWLKKGAGRPSNLYVVVVPGHSSESMIQFVETKVGSDMTKYVTNRLSRIEYYTHELSTKGSFSIYKHSKIPIYSATMDLTVDVGAKRIEFDECMGFKTHKTTHNSYSSGVVKHAIRPTSLQLSSDIQAHLESYESKVI